MQENELKKLVQDTVAETLAQLEQKGWLKDNEKTDFEKTESLLRNLNELKKNQEEEARRAALVIGNAMAAMKKEPYAGVLKAFYLEGKTNAQCAAAENCDERTARRKRRQMVEAIEHELKVAGLLRERWPWE